MTGGGRLRLGGRFPEAMSHSMRFALRPGHDQSHQRLLVRLRGDADIGRASRPQRVGRVNLCRWRRPHLGPLFLPGETACHVCYLLRRAANLGFGELEHLLDGHPSCAPAGPALESLVAATAASLAVRWIGALDPRLPGVLLAVEPDGGLRVTRHLVLRVPRCPACSPTRRLAPPAPWFDPATRFDPAGCDPAGFDAGQAAA